MFDSQADVAALVYGSGDDPDDVLHDFGVRLRDSGYRAVGLVQRSGRVAAAGKTVPAVALPRMTPMPLRHTYSATGCHLHADHLAEMKRMLSAAIRNEADVVIINRFGKLEADGAGLVDLIREAVATDLPVVIAVAQERFMAWTRFSAGMGIKLRCTRHDLDDWWQTVAPLRRAPAPPTPPTLCEIIK